MRTKIDYARPPPPTAGSYLRGVGDRPKVMEGLTGSLSVFTHHRFRVLRQVEFIRTTVILFVGLQQLNDLYRLW